MRVIVADTLEEIQRIERRVYELWVQLHDDEEYLKTTDKWEEPRQRLDGRYSIPYYERMSPTCLTILDYNVNDYPTTITEGG